MPASTALRQPQNASLTSCVGNLKIQNKKEVVKKLRVRIDALIQAAKTAICSAETTLAYRELQLAKAWLGKSLEYLMLNSDAAAILYAGGLPLNKSFVPFELPNQPVKKFSVMDALIGESVSIKSAVVANCPIEHQQKECFDECVKCLLRAEFWYREEIVRIRDEKQASERNQKGMEEILGNPILIPDKPGQEPSTEAEQAKVAVAFASFDGEKNVNDIIEQPKIKAKWLDGTDMVYDFAKNVNTEGDVEFQESITSKISENEDQGSQEKQPKTPRKKR